MDYSGIAPYYPFKEINGSYFEIMVLSRNGTEAMQLFTDLVKNNVMNTYNLHDFVKANPHMDRIINREIMYFNEDDSQL